MLFFKLFIVICGGSSKVICAFLLLRQNQNLTLFMVFKVEKRHYRPLHTVVNQSCASLKGMFAKNERVYRLTAKNDRFWSLLILLLSVSSIRRKLLKWLILINIVSIQIQKVFYNFLIIDATDISKISSNQKRLFFAVSLHPLSFFANIPFKERFA